MAHTKRAIWLNTLGNLTYLFGLLSSIIALVIIYQISLDFFNPLRMELSLQMMDLTEEEIIILDIVEILIYLTLLVFVVIGAVRKQKKLILIGSICIWIFFLIDFAIIEPYFRYKIV